MDASIGKYLSDGESTPAEIGRRDVVERIWWKARSVWKPDPSEITNRLGWLNVADLIREQVSTLESFAREVQHDSLRQLVLLGMGGSSLGPEELRETFGSIPGYTECIVLDCTMPACMQAVTEAIDPADTPFLVSSKSGTTIEPLSLFQEIWIRNKQVVAVKSQPEFKPFFKLNYEEFVNKRLKMRP
jgi:glucose-6-phosphate isomerase